MSVDAYKEQERARGKIIRIHCDRAFPWKRFWATLSALDKQRMDPNVPGHAHPPATEDVFCSAAILTDRLAREMKCNMEGFLFTLWRERSQHLFVFWAGNTKRVIAIHRLIEVSWVRTTQAENLKCDNTFRR